MDFNNLPFKFDHYYYVEVDGNSQNAKVSTYNPNYEDVPLTAQQSKEVSACFFMALISGSVSQTKGSFFARPNQNGDIKVTWYR